jgi:hypothetical protein
MVNANGHCSCISIVPRPLPKVSRSKKNISVKLGTTKTPTVHMTSFKVENAFSTTFFHTKAFFYSRAVNVDVIHS